MQCVDGFGILLQRYVTKGNDAKNPAIFSCLLPKEPILDPRALVFYHVTDGDKSSGELHARVARIWLQGSRSACSCFQKPL